MGNVSTTTHISLLSIKKTIEDEDIMIDAQYTEYDVIIMSAGFASIYQARHTAQKAPSARARTAFASG